MNKIIEIREHGLMLTDYFHGTSGVWINIYVTPETTKTEVIEQFENEINSIYDHIEFTAEYHNTDIDYTMEQIEKWIEETKKYIEPEKDMPCFPDMEYIEDEENAVLIFTIEFMVSSFKINQGDVYHPRTNKGV